MRRGYLRPDAIRDMVRDALGTGRLPRTQKGPERTYAALGAKFVCCVCQRPDECQYSVVETPTHGRLYAHPSCYTLWCEASAPESC
jgi:hypothetical protein